MRAWSGTIKEMANSGAALIAQTKPQRYSPRSWQWSVLAACACLSLLTILLARNFGHWYAASWASSHGLESSDSDFARTQIGTFVIRGQALGDCRGYRYDNLTGEALPDSAPCRQIAQPDIGTAVIDPDAVRHIDALRKAFVAH
jgi:hypothetical protein